LFHQAALALGVLLASTAWAAGENSQPQSAATAAIKLVDVHQLAAERARHRGHPLFVNFWATWCEPCKEELPTIVKAAEMWRPRGIHFISVSTDDPNDVKLVEDELRKLGAHFDSVLIATGDPDSMIRAADEKWSGTLPASFLYAPSGKRIRSKIGIVDAKLLHTWFAHPGT